MKNLFTISQVCKCCGVSRSTVLRMEKRGLLSPAFVDENTGYRYYDNNNVTKILHIQMFLSMGLTYDDAYLYYASEGKSPEILSALKSRISLLKQTYEEMKLRIDDKQHLSTEIIKLPEYVCYQKEYRGSSFSDKYRDMYNLFGETVEKGYKPLMSKRLFIINKGDNLLENEDKNPECNYICCVPLDMSCADENTVFYPSCTAFSILYYGGYNAINKAYEKFGRKIRELGLKPTDYPRIIGIVNGYTSEKFKPKNHVSRLVVPIEDLTDDEINRINRIIK